MNNNQDPNDRKALLKNALVALDEMQTRLDAVEQAKTEPIAIVGMGCRFPGGVQTPEAFWKLLQNGEDVIREVPSNRWNTADYAGLNVIWYGGFLDDIDLFDPQFFGIAPREADSMDPQQRMVLEVAWEALENAGQAPDKLSGSQTGVFVGVTTNDYAQLVKQANPTDMDVYSATGTALNAVAGRVAYMLGLQGPCMSVDTACSSSLVAIHLAIQSLRSQECNLAITGGVNATLVPENFICFAGWGMMAPDGRCKTFDARANGFVRGEGCGIVVLKRLSDALANDDSILAVIRGSAVNQDGRSSGLTVPNGPAQQQVIRSALKNARVKPSDISYFEAHGTGTAIGDPIEVEALGAVLGEGRRDDQPLFLGSVKTNIGHLESASGVAGLIKVILCLQNEAIPPHLHFHERSPRIPWPDFETIIPTTNVPWPAGEYPRFAGVSSFGFSGTNAHIIIEEAPARPIVETDVERPLHILSLSAKDETALRELAVRYDEFLSAQNDVVNAAFTANTGRAHFNHRLAVVAESTDQMSQQLRAFAAGKDAPDVSYGLIQTNERPKIAFLFTGQGSQYVGMGWELYQTEETFRQALDTCDQLLRPYLEHSLLSVLYPEEGQASPLDHTAYTQPALFALEYALAKLWQSWGIEPTAVMGHSVGEYVAACIAGVLTLEDGLRLIALRGKLMGALPAGGQMVAVFADEARVAAAIEPYKKDISIAAINGPKNIVISGAAQAIGAVQNELTANGIKFRSLNVSHAFHSPLMDSILNEFERTAKTIQFNKPRISLVSNVTGKIADSQVQTPAYWKRHIREAVRFGDSVTALYQKGCTIFLEIGPGSTLLGMGQQCLPESDSPLYWLSSLRKGQSDWKQMLTSLGALYTHGAPVDWAGFDRGYPRRHIPLPTYPFQREHYWIAAPKKSAAKPQNAGSSGHPLLGKPIVSPLIKETLFQVPVSNQYPAFLPDHRIYDAVVFPGTAYLEMALAAGMRLDKGSQTVENLTIQEALILPENTERTVQFVLAPQNQGKADFQVLSLESGQTESIQQASSWKLHATGRIVAGQAAISAGTPSLSEIQSISREAVPVEQYYQQLRDSGLNYGESFRCITGLWVDSQNQDVLGRIQIDDAEARGYHLFPGVLDACFQLLGALLPSDEGNIYLPLVIEQLRFSGLAATDIWAYASIRGTDLRQETLVSDLRLFDNNGNVVAELEGLHLKRASRQTLERLMRSSENHDDWLYEVDWELKALVPANNPTAGQWLILADQSGLGTQLAADLEAQGVSRCDLVFSTDIKTETYNDLFDNTSYEGIVYLGALDNHAPDGQVDLRSSEHVLQLIQAMAKRGDVTSRLWIVTRNVHHITQEPGLSVEQSPLWGLGRVIGLEHAGLWGGLVDVDQNTSTALLAQEMLQADGENQIAIRENQRYVARLVHRQALHPGMPVELVITSPGILDNLELHPLSRRAPGPGEVEVQVQASGLNFRDVLNALGMYPGVAPLGNECTGIIVAVGEGVNGFSAGDEVIALGSGTFKSFVITTADQVFHKPKNLNFAEAVSIPTTFLTADYGLNHLAQIKAGQRVLIHSAAGGVGLAAVQLAQRVGAEIFATAGSPEKRAFLQSIGVQHVMNSRTLDFAEQIMMATGGEGVDVVLNSLADDFIPRSLSILAEGGTFLEIGKRGIWEADQVAASFPSVNYYVYDLVVVLDDDPNLIWGALHQLLEDFETGRLKPLPMQTFSIQNASDAFHYMAQARHIGKIVVTHDNQLVAENVIRPDATYLITGGLGGLGLKVAGWMIEQGARHLLLVGRSSPSDEARELIQTWQESGSQVEVAPVDISQFEQIAAVLDDVNRTMPPLRGVIHAAGVLDDGLLVNQAWAHFERVFSPKVQGSWNLHLLTQESQLDFFVMFSAGAALLGSSGQGNYAAANAFLDGLAHYRHTQGLPALSINWGGWSEVGMAAALSEQHQQRLAEQGISSIAPDQGVKILEHLIQQNALQTAVLPINWVKLGQQFTNVPDFLSEVMGQAAQVAVEEDTSTSEPTLLKQLESAAPGEKRELLIDAVREQVIKVLRLNASAPPALRQGLTEIGMDSLMAVELSNRLKVLLGQPLPATLAFEYPTILALADYLEEHILTSVIKPEESVSGTIQHSIESELKALSDEEIEASLLEELKKAGY